MNKAARPFVNSRAIDKSYYGNIFKLRTRSAPALCVSTVIIVYGLFLFVLACRGFSTTVSVIFSFRFFIRCPEREWRALFVRVLLLISGVFVRGNYCLNKQFLLECEGTLEELSTSFVLNSDQL